MGEEEDVVVAELLHGSCSRIAAGLQGIGAAAHGLGDAAQDGGFIRWRKKKSLPSAAGPGFGCLFMMHGRIFHVHRLWKPLPSTAGPGFRSLCIMNGRWILVKRRW